MRSMLAWRPVWPRPAVMRAMRVIPSVYALTYEGLGNQQMALWARRHRPGHHRSSSSAPALGGRVPEASQLACAGDHRASLAPGRAAPPPLVAVGRTRPGTPLAGATARRFQL